MEGEEMVPKALADGAKKQGLKLYTVPDQLGRTFWGLQNKKGLTLFVADEFRCYDFLFGYTAAKAE